MGKTFKDKKDNEGRRPPKLHNHRDLPDYQDLVTDDWDDQEYDEYWYDKNLHPKNKPNE